uniref:Uncharacterized protein n=1 Tax=Kalanchoe fedtschenkoi TaxID=63787 RepID=A0A7N0UED9_KALFE
MSADSTTSCCCCWSRSSRSRNLRHQHVASTRLICASFWVLIIIAQITMLYSINCSAHSSGNYILWPHPRKLLLLRDAAANSAASHGSATQVNPGRNNDDDSDTIYDADKRKVHTGPNPLHN